MYLRAVDYQAASGISLDVLFKGRVMRICHVCNVHPADDARVFHRTCVGLAEAGYEVHLFAVANCTDIYRERGVVIHPLPECQRRRERFSRRVNVAQMAADLKPDLFHVHEPELLRSIILQADQRPIIYDVHESYLDVLMERDWIPRWARPLARSAWDKWERHLIPKCAAIVAATDYIAARYQRLHPRVVLIRNFSAVAPAPSARRWLDRDGCTCVFAGLLQPDRNIANTIRALGILHRRGVVAQLWLAGKWSSDSYKEEIMSLACSEGVGHQVQYFGVLPRADAVALQ